MKKNVIKISFLLLLALFIIPINFVNAGGKVVPTAINNLRVSLRSTSKLVSIDSGYMRVFYDENKVCIEYYDNNFNIKSKKSVSMELDIWGGFYAGKDAYYLVEGQTNEQEDFNAEVIRVIKYDTNWNRLGAAKITGDSKLWGGEVRYPFHNGCVEMEESNGKLYIVTSHQGYVDESLTPKMGHQGFLMIEVDEKSMTGKIVKGDYWHSFSQYIEIKDSNIYVLEQSEGSRCTSLTKYNSEKVVEEYIPVLEYGGNRTSAWAVSCYASVNDMTLSSNNVLCLGTSIDQTQYDNYSSEMSYNIYLTLTPMNNFSKESTQVKWLTNYNNDGKRFAGVKITKINDNRFMISWKESNETQTVLDDDPLSENVLHYIFVDGNGNKISKEYKIAASISDCHPIVKNSKIVFYASNGNIVDFYSIDANNGSFNKKSYCVAGENITWKLDNGVLTLEGTGDISIDQDYYSTSVWSTIREKVEKIVIKKGITSIPDNTFVYFPNLTEIEIEDGLKSIGKEAFRSCGKLNKITIPSSVKTIGDDALWTGWYSSWNDAHIVDATIFAKSNSYAIKYAIQNKINFKLTDTVKDLEVKSRKEKEITLKWAKINGNITGYKVYYYDYNQKKWIFAGKTSATEYRIKELKKGTTYKFRVRAYKTVSGKQHFGSYSSSLKTSTKPKVTKINNITTKNNKVTIKWKKVSAVTGYAIYMSTNKNNGYEKIKTIKGKNTIKYTTKKLNKNKTYYFKIRTYKTVDGKKVYSSYSTIKKIKVK